MTAALRPLLSQLTRIARGLALGSALLGAAATQAAEWPDRPITMLMGFPAGSGVDVIARSIQEPLQQELGVPIVIDYRSGAGGASTISFVRVSAMSLCGKTKNSKWSLARLSPSRRPSVSASGLGLSRRSRVNAGTTRSVAYQYDATRRLTQEAIDHLDPASDRTTANRCASAAGGTNRWSCGSLPPHCC